MFLAMSCAFLRNDLFDASSEATWIARVVSFHGPVTQSILALTPEIEDTSTLSEELFQHQVEETLGKLGIEEVLRRYAGVDAESGDESGEGAPKGASTRSTVTSSRSLSQSSKTGKDAPLRRSHSHASQ